jgi:hypothetical protein
MTPDKNRKSKKVWRTVFEQRGSSMMFCLETIKFYAQNNIYEINRFLSSLNLGKMCRSTYCGGHRI